MVLSVNIDTLDQYPLSTLTQYSIDTPLTPWLILNRHSIDISVDSPESTSFADMPLSVD